MTMHDQQSFMRDSVIIGAGVAGLAAAQRLLAAGMQPLVLEARDRIGGRVWTDRSHAPVELGAEFIHGQNALTWEIVRSAGIPTRPWKGARRFAQSGAILPHDASNALLERSSALYDAVGDYSGPELSAAEVVAQRTTPDDAAAFFALRLLANIEGADINRLSASVLTNEHRMNTAGPDNFRFVDGYDHVPQALAQGVEVMLNSPVERIAWSDDGVLLTLTNGDDVRARRVIVTVPLGVLQAGRPLFDPPLPEAKRSAIDAIAMGHVTKIILWFDRVLWEPFGFLSTDGLVSTWWPSGTEASPALTGYTGGNAALVIDQLNEGVAVAQALEEVVSLFGKEARSAFLGGRRTNWASDPWSLGAYTYSPVGVGDARARLAAPLADTLFFAGEATLTNGHLATVHGAIESGRRAADEIIQASTCTVS